MGVCYDLYNTTKKQVLAMDKYGSWDYHKIIDDMDWDPEDNICAISRECMPEFYRWVGGKEIYDAETSKFYAMYQDVIQVDQNDNLFNQFVQNELKDILSSEQMVLTENGIQSLSEFEKQKKLKANQLKLRTEELKLKRSPIFINEKNNTNSEYDKLMKQMADDNH